MKTLVAFWANDCFPYLLHGTVEDIDDKARVKIKEYGGWFNRAVVMLPELKGKEVGEELKRLRAEYESAQKELHELFLNKLVAVAPFADDYIKTKRKSK